MKRALRRTLGLLLCSLAAAVPAPAARAAGPGWSGEVYMRAGTPVTISYASPLSDLPPNGCMPVLITVNNRSTSPRTYNFQLRNNDGYRSGGGGREMTAFQAVTAAPDTEVRALALLPVSPLDRSTQAYRPATISVYGDGVETSQIPIADSYRPSSQRTVYVGMADSLGARSWNILDTAVSHRSRYLWGSRIDLKLLPPDWRALSGLQCLWLTAQDYATLDAGQKTAVQDWVSLGGILYVCEATPDPATRAEYGVSDSTAVTTTRGFGEVRWFACDPAKELPTDPVVSQIFNLDHFETGIYQDATDWGIAPAVGKLRLNVPLLLGFIGLFAILVGPVNLFYFARADRRHRLFWTTPAISLGASLLLIVVIILQDGFGGDGARVSLTYLLPAQNKAITVQEQLSRTGVLLARGFTAADGVLLTPVAVGNGGNAQLQQNGTSYGGDWFVSRRIQAQRLIALQPTRARVQLLNVEQSKDGAPPKIVSSLPAELDQLYFMDAKGRSWRGARVRTGEPQTLQPATEFYKTDAAVRGSMYLEMLRVATVSRGANGRTGNEPFFYAVADHQLPFIDTLRSIRWVREQAVYAGPVTN